MKRLVAIIGAVLGVSAFGDSVWQLNSSDPTWWFTESAWTAYPPSGNVTLSPNVNNGKANIFLQDGDVVSGIGNVFPGYAGKSGGKLFFQIRKGAKFSFTGTMSSTEQGSTNVIDIAGGWVRGNSFQPGPHLKSMNYVYVTNGADVAFASMSLGRLGPVDLHVEDSAFLVTNGNPTIGRADGTFIARWYGKNAVLGPKSIAVQQYGQLLLEDSSLDGGFNAETVGAVVRLTNTVVTASTITLGNKNKTPGDTVELELVGDKTSLGTLTQLAIYNNVKYIQRGGTVEIVRDAKDLNAFLSDTTAGSSAEQSYEVRGGTLSMTNLQANGGAAIQLSGCGKATFRQYGGTVSSYGVYFNASGADAPRYEIFGGTFGAHGHVGNQTAAGIMDAADSVSKSGVFSIYGGAPEVRLQRIGSYGKTARQPQIDFVICTNGIPTIYMDAPPVSVCNWINGYFTIRPQGGVQLMHADTVTLLDATVSKRNMTCQNLNAGGTLLPNAALWTPGATSTTHALAVSLVESAELANGVLYPEGKSCGYLKLPKIRESWTSVAVNLDLVPQGAETIETLIAGFNAAGYKATAATGDYNVALEIPRELLVNGSVDEKILIDFAEYADAEAVRDAQPTVRALVRRVGFSKVGAGLMIILR